MYYIYDLRQNSSRSLWNMKRWAIIAGFTRKQQSCAYKDARSSGAHVVVRFEVAFTPKRSGKEKIGLRHSRKTVCTVHTPTCATFTRLIPRDQPIHGRCNKNEHEQSSAKERSSKNFQEAIAHYAYRFYSYALLIT